MLIPNVVCRMMPTGEALLIICFGQKSNVQPQQTRPTNNQSARHVIAVFDSDIHLCLRQVNKNKLYIHLPASYLCILRQWRFRSCDAATVSTTKQFTNNNNKKKICYWLKSS